MAITVVRIYDDFTAAERARSELLHSGFGEGSVQLTTREDEAGPAQGNFVLPAKDRAPGRGRGFFSLLFSGGSAPDSRVRQNRGAQIVRCGVYLLTVDAGDDAQYERAADIMNRHGAFDVDRITANRPSP